MVVFHNTSDARHPTKGGHEAVKGDRLTLKQIFRAAAEQVGLRKADQGGAFVSKSVDDESVGVPVRRLGREI